MREPVKFLIKLFVLSLSFQFILPLIHGISVQGGLATSFGLALMFSLIGWLFRIIAAAVSVVLAFSTLGLALLALVPLWLIGFWLVPALILKVTAMMMPGYLAIHGWGPAFIGGLITLVVSAFTDVHMMHDHKRIE